MKLKYMIDFVYDEKRFEKGLDPYVPAGVWGVTPTSFDMGYLPGFEEREDEVNWMLNDWIEQGIDPWLNEGFLEYWQESRSLTKEHSVKSSRPKSMKTQESASRQFWRSCTKGTHRDCFECPKFSESLWTGSQQIVFYSVLV